jgi:hypothetical protein
MSALDGAEGTLRSKKILRDGGYRRGEIGIVGTPLD